MIRAWFRIDWAPVRGNFQFCKIYHTRAPVTFNSRILKQVKRPAHHHPSYICCWHFPYPKQKAKCDRTSHEQLPLPEPTSNVRHNLGGGHRVSFEEPLSYSMTATERGPEGQGFLRWRWQLVKRLISHFSSKEFLKLKSSAPWKLSCFPDQMGETGGAVILENHGGGEEARTFAVGFAWVGRQIAASSNFTRSMGGWWLVVMWGGSIRVPNEDEGN